MRDHLSSIGISNKELAWSAIGSLLVLFLVTLGGLYYLRDQAIEFRSERDALRIELFEVTKGL